MSHPYKNKEMPHTAITDSGIARVLPSKELDYGDPFKWLKLGVRDMARAPMITLFFGLIFAAIPWGITYLVAATGWHLVIFPAMIGFMLIGPLLAAGLYDVSWELEKGHTPKLWHSLKAIHRNTVNEWGFAVLLTVLMIFWMRIASILHAFYPPHPGENYENLIPFLVVGTLVGAFFATVVFSISVFTQPILMERKVNIMTAILTSLNTVWLNKGPMLVWASIIFFSVLFGFFTAFFGFIILMPLLGYATWHGYIDVIETKIERKYE